MAIFHCSVSHGSRKGGQSGAAKVDYIMRTGKYIGDAGEVIGACAGHLPGCAGGNPRVLFAAADEFERLNGRLFTQVLFAIPNELSDRDALLLAYHYAEALTENGAPYALGVHRGGVEVADGETVSAAPQEVDEERLPPHNRHGHLLICERIDDGLERTAREWFRRANKKEPALGGAAKDRKMNGGDWVPEVRRLCADYINYGLERAGFSERVTCESHETRIARAEAAGDEDTAERLRLNPPGIHLGPTAWAIEKGRPGRPARASWRGDLNRAIAAGGERLRGEVEELNAKLGQLDVQEAGVNERLEAARRVAAVQFEQREKALQGTSIGEEILRAVRVEMVGGSAAPPSVVQLGEMLEAAEQRFDAALDLREEGLRETSVGSRYLDAATELILGAGQSPTLPQRERIIATAEGWLAQDLDRVEEELRDREVELRSFPLGAQYLSEAEQEWGEGAAVLAARDVIVTSTEQRLERELDSRKQSLVSSAGSDEVLLEAFSEGSSLPERWRILELAERWYEKVRVEDAEQSAAVDDVEAMLKETATGARHLAAAGQEVVDEGQEPSSLAARETVVRRAWSRVEQEQDDREASLSDRRCGSGWDDVDGAVLCAMKLAELEEGGQEGAGPHPGRREQALAWAERQMDRVDALREAEALELVGRPRRPAGIERSLDDAEQQQHEAAERRRGRVAALSEDERLFFEEKLAALDPRQRENPVHVDAALDHARTRVAALDEEIERRRADIEQTPGDGYARLLAAGFAKASRQEKVEALTAREAVLAEDFDRREERIRSDGEGEAFLRRGRREVLGNAEGQPKTLPERGRVIAAAEAHQRLALELAEERRAKIERFEEAVHATKEGPGWLSEAAQRVLQGANRQPSLDEREQIVGMVAGWIRTDLDRRQQDLRSTKNGAWFLAEARRSAGAVETLAAEERLVDAAQDGLRAFQEAEARRSARRSARWQRLFQQPGGEDLYYAVLTGLDPRWRDKGETEGKNIDAALAAAESDDERLGRLRDVLANPAEAARYREVLEARGETFTVKDIDEAIDAVLRERAAAEARRQAEAQQRRELDRREAPVRATKRGPGWLSEAQRRILRGTDRQPTLEEREWIVETVAGWVREDLDRRKKELRSTEQGAGFLDEAQRSASAVTTLAAAEQLVEAGEKRLRQHQEAQARRTARQRELWMKPGGKDLYYAVLTGLDPQWRPGGKTAVKNIDAALAAAESDDERRGRLRDVLADPSEAARYREALEARGETFTVQDIDAAVDAVLRERAAAEARRQAKEQQRRELDRREAQVRATSAGEQRLKKEQSARFGAKRSLTLDEQLSVVEAVERELCQEFDDREVAIQAEAGGGELLRRVEGRRGAPRNLAQREELIENVDQVLRAADEAEGQLPTTLDPKRSGCRVSAVIDAMLDAVPADDDDPFVGDVVFVLGARNAQRTQEGVAEGGYAAAAREESAQRHFGSAVVDAMKWCVLKVREIILAACHKILGGGGESGQRVQASLEAAGAERQAQQSAVESAAQQVAIDVDAFSQSALGDGRDPVSALEEETVPRRKVLQAAQAAGVDFQKVFAEAEKKQSGSGFAAIEAATNEVVSNLERRELYVWRFPGGKERLLAEEQKILRGASRQLTPLELDTAVSAVEAWTEEEIRGHVRRIVAEMRDKFGFVPPAGVVCAAGRALREQYDPEQRPGRLVSALEQLPDETGAPPSDEVLHAALNDQRRAKHAARNKENLERYQQALKKWKQDHTLSWSDGFSAGYPKPKKPKKDPDPVPPSREQIEQFRKDLIAGVAAFVRQWVKQEFETWEDGGGGSTPPPVGSRVRPPWVSPKRQHQDRKSGLDR